MLILQLIKSGQTPSWGKTWERPSIEQGNGPIKISVNEEHKILNNKTIFSLSLNSNFEIDFMKMKQLRNKTALA